MENKKKILITGGSGYVGAMLVEQFADRDDVEKIVCIDKEPKSELWQDKENVQFIHKNLAENWEEDLVGFNPDVVIHTAWQIREMYGKKDEQWKWNVGGSDKVFDYAFKTPSVKKLIHFSTVSSYSAMPSNTLEHYFNEEESFRDSDYLYAIEKREAEKHLKLKFEEAKIEHRDQKVPQVFIIRPAAITGPRGRYMRVRFGLQAALSGQLKKTKSIWHKIVTALVSFTPVTKKWVRQFIHEDDIVDIVKLFTFTELPGEYEIFNAAPPGDVVYGKNMARAVGKKTLRIHPWLVRIAFFLIWHLSHGKIPTSKGGWKAYSYPILVDGSKITKKYGFKYRMSSLEAFTKIEGRYEKYVPEEFKQGTVEKS